MTNTWCLEVYAEKAHCVILFFLLMSDGGCFFHLYYHLFFCCIFLSSHHQRYETYFAAVETWYLLMRLLKLSCNANVGEISSKASGFRDFLEFAIHFSNINKILLI